VLPEDETPEGGDYLFNNKFIRGDLLQTIVKKEIEPVLMLPQQTQTENRSFLKSIFNMIND